MVPVDPYPVLRAIQGKDQGTQLKCSKAVQSVIPEQRKDGKVLHLLQKS